ncbi:MAG TPA: fibronectin type III domain-containing protein, partial [Candidatus Deferrimicrobium sp.]|nr:fibronectin type III domain-containing protein [Candidatus Deferrimicrobium sp.]
ANLQQLTLERNQLSGPIPPELGNLANLKFLILNSNQLSGLIPPELVNLHNLQWLFLYDNKLSGPILPELGNLSNLERLSLERNQLSGPIPTELVNLTNLQFLILGGNQLSGPIPPELGNLHNLQQLILDGNQLGGPIPPELGDLGNLRYLWLSSNQLSDSIPFNLIYLIFLLEDYGIDLRWNSLYTHDYILGNILNSKQIGNNWGSTQTIAPSDVTATVVSISSIEIGWTPIVYTSDTGGYRVFYSTTPGGPYTYFGMTADKSASSLTVTGLNPGVTYYFVVQTRTNPHGSNQNIVDSEYSVEVSTATLQNITISGTVTFGGSGLQGVTITLDNGGGTAVTDANGNYSATVPYDWSGTVTPSKTGYDFTPANRSYTNVTVNQTNQDFQGSQVPGLALTSPNGGESWGLNTLRNITWTSAGLAGNIKLELWKASQKLGVIAANISISNGTYAWFVGSYGLGIASTGNDYKVKIMTANGLYNDTGNAPFSILQTSLILTSPRSNESWKLGTLKDITWTSVGLSGNVKLLLFKNGVQIGVIARGIPVTNGTYAWTVGKIYSGLAPTGSNYKVKISSEANPSYSSGSGIFTIL